MKELYLKYGIVGCPKSEPTRQMVLGTDNQEKELVAPKLPGAPFLYPNVPPPYLGAPLHKSHNEEEGEHKLKLEFSCPDFLPRAFMTCLLRLSNMGSSLGF